MKPVLEIRNVSKKFLIDHERPSYLSLRDRFSSLLKPTSKREEFWALNDISFDVFPGDSFGIIGKNGAGKSTLLKVLSRITSPTKGNIVIRGRIASLLEVGTGFHQELTGRENIFMNGSILGMKKVEIKNRFDEIVAFSGVEKFLDTPLKHYSSGMQLRLAFAVAAHLESEILIVDEVLAVGDGEFQRKCMTKMEDVQQSGRTILFVSHNLPSLKKLCRNGLLLESGKLILKSDIDSVISHYTSEHHSNRKIMDGLRHLNQHGTVNNITINGNDSNTQVLNNRFMTLQVDLTLHRKTAFELQIHLKKDDVFLCSYANFTKSEISTFEPGHYKINYELIFPDIRSGNYKIDIYFTEPFVTWFANTINDVKIEFMNETHQSFLNTPSFNWWGACLIEGSRSVEKI